MNIYKKVISITIIVFLILNCTFVQAAQLDKATAEIMVEYIKWITDENSDPTSDEMVRKIRELCNDNVEQIQKLGAINTSGIREDIEKAGVAWPYAGNGNFPWYGSAYGDNVGTDLSLAIQTAASQAKNGVSSSDVSVDDKKQLEQKIKEQYEEIKKSDDYTYEQLRTLDLLLQEYDAKYSWDSTGASAGTGLDGIAQDVDKRFEEKFGNAKINTAYKRHWNIRTEITGTDDIFTSKPSTGLLGSSTPNSSHTIDEIIGESKDFINQGKDGDSKISTSNLQAGSNTLYNILLGIGVFSAVAVGMYLAIKFMLSSAEDKAKVKESLIPYIAGCVVIFGAFTIWKLAIVLLSNIA